MLKRLLTLATHNIYSLPVIILMPHSSCNCRCVMCDIWKANHHKKEIAVESLGQHIATFKKLQVREVVLSGGEALMHSNLWKLCELLKSNRIRITLLSTGLLLKKHAQQIVASIDQVIVSLDGSEQVHDRIRNVPQAFARLKEGVRELKRLKADFRITGRCVLQRGNFFDFIEIVKAAETIGLDQISFLAADVSSEAFNRPSGWPAEKTDDVALNEAEAMAFDKIVSSSITVLEKEFRTSFVAESPAKIKRIADYFKAIRNLAAYPETTCNAPWVSAVIESDGEVRPCFFHRPYGNINEMRLDEILNSGPAINFRKNLNVQTDETCKKCVCSLKLRPYQMQ
jgi:MoaA/NifB/PqqE/SkfB family radical SAM enzyme